MRILMKGLQAFDKPSLMILYKWKYCKAASGLNKEKIREAWIKAKDSAPKDKKTWTTEDQEKLERLKTDQITIQDTEVGREASKVLDEAIAVLSICSQDQVQRLRKAITTPGQDLQAVPLPSQELQVVPQSSQELQVVTPSSQELQVDALPSQELQDVPLLRQDLKYEQELI